MDSIDMKAFAIDGDNVIDYVLKIIATDIQNSPNDDWCTDKEIKRDSYVHYRLL